MAMKAVQQIMLGSVCRTEHEAADTLDRIHALGYEGIELNGFMIRKTSPIVRLLTRAAGMPVGKGGSYDWAKLIRDSGLAVTAVHEDLGMIGREPETVLREADSFGTDKIVVTGMYRFDMSSQKAVADLAGRLNRSGRILSKSGVQLLFSFFITTITASSGGLYLLGVPNPMPIPMRENQVRPSRRMGHDLGKQIPPMSILSNTRIRNS